jgi:hypothetical protein
MTRSKNPICKRETIGDFHYRQRKESLETLKKAKEQETTKKQLWN